MKTAPREILRGLAGGVGFVIAISLLAMPWWLAAVLGLGLYAGTSLLLPPPPRREQDWVALGFSPEDRDQFLARCRTSAAEMKQVIGRLAAGDFRQRVENLTRTAGSLADYLEKKPESMLLANSIPQNLEHLVKMLRQYVELSEYPVRAATVAEALRSVEGTVGNVCVAFDGIYHQLLSNDVAALKASASSLEFLLGVDSELATSIPERKILEFPDSTASSQKSAPGRPRQMEKPL